MTTDRPDTRRAPRGTYPAVPTPRTTSVPLSGFGVSAISLQDQGPQQPAVEPERRSRAVTVAGALLAVVALVAAVVAFRIMVPTTPPAAAGGVTQAVSDEIREQPGSVVIYGQPHTYGDGLEVAVNAPQRYQASSNATGADEGVPVKVQVVVTNRTDEAFRPNTLQMQVTSAGQPGTTVWDPDQGIALTGPDVSVPAGASVHFHLAFAVADPADMEIEITPALFGYGPTVVRSP